MSDRPYKMTLSNLYHFFTNDHKNPCQYQRFPHHSALCKSLICIPQPLLPQKFSLYHIIIFIDILVIHDNH